MDNIVEIFKALADETRLRILNLFIKSGRDLCVCELTDSLKLPQYHISKHLNILRSAGFFIQERKGTWIYYNLDTSDSSNQKLFGFLEDYLTDDRFEEDFELLKQRLLLREEGKCVVGFIPEKDLLKKIQMKTKEV